MWSRSASSNVTGEDVEGTADSNSERGTVSTVPCDRMTARSITFCSSRMLPGHDQLCGSPCVTRNDHAKQVEVGDRLKRNGQRRQELFKVSVTTDQVDDTC